LVLYKKLFDIDRHGHKRALLNRKPLFKFNKDIQHAHKKNEIIKIAQENLFMLKRLREKTSYFNNKKWRDDYLKSQSYKKNRCEFTPIDFTISTKKSRINESNIQLTDYARFKFNKTISGNLRKNKIRKRFEEFDYREFLRDDELKKDKIEEKNSIEEQKSNEDKKEDNKPIAHEVEEKKVMKNNKNITKKNNRAKTQIKPIKMKKIFDIDTNNNKNENKRGKTRSKTLENNKS
jgi:hypothetical protein